MYFVGLRPSGIARYLLQTAALGATYFASIACSVYDPSLLEAPLTVAGGDGGDTDRIPTGGAASGGAASGGAASGGTASGGTATGGVNEAGRASAGSAGSENQAGGAAGTASGAGGTSAGAPQGGGSGGCADCSKASLVHRYSFSGNGTAIVDSTGEASGEAVNSTLKAAGTLSLSGGTTDAYVNLPNGIISSLVDATFETWFVWDGGNPWQRIFDFGNNSKGEGMQGFGTTYLFLCPSTDEGHLRAAFSTNGNTVETAVEMTTALATAQTVQVDVVVDDTNDLISMYVDGTFTASVAFDGHLAQLQDANNWLGRSQFADPSLSGSLNEFRIYGAALTAKQVMLNHSTGPDAL